MKETIIFIEHVRKNGLSK